MHAQTGFAVYAEGVQSYFGMATDLLMPYHMLGAVAALAHVKRCASLSGFLQLSTITGTLRATSVIYLSRPVSAQRPGAADGISGPSRQLEPERTFYECSR